MKRYYYDVYKHKFPNTYGHAKCFWNIAAGQGKFKKGLVLYQYYNDYTTQPKVGDLVCFPLSKYGQVAIVAKIGDTTVEVIQQNIKGKTRGTYKLKSANGKFSMTNGDVKPIGWLRKK